MNIVNPEAVRIGLLAQDYRSGIFAHASILEIASHPNSKSLAPHVEEGQNVPVGRVRSRDGGRAEYHLTYYLERLADPQFRQEYEKIYIIGAILKLGDELSKNNYFDRAPELELLRHVRNGIAHGNRFEIRDPASLVRFPAHNRLNIWHGESIFEITPDLHGCPVLFDFMHVGDCSALLASITDYLLRMGHGESNSRMKRPEPR